MQGLTSSELLCFLESCKDPVPGAARKACGVPAPRSQRQHPVPKARGRDGLEELSVTRQRGCLRSRCARTATPGQGRVTKEHAGTRLKPLAQHHRG